jgi:hypothetical protein
MILQNPIHDAKQRWPAAPMKGGHRKFRHGRKLGGGDRIRTDDLLLAKQALSQLSYTPDSGIGYPGSNISQSARYPIPDT